MLKCKLLIMSYFGSVNILLIMLLFASAKTTAQTEKALKGIYGNIVDESSNEIPYATVSILTYRDSVLVDGTIADDHGKFKIDKLSNGIYLIKIESIGYIESIIGPHSFSIEGTINLGSVVLKPDVIKLAEVAILDRKKLIEKFPNKMEINVEKSILASGKNASQLIEIAPGVKINSNGSISLNGKAGVNVFVDGKPVYLSGSQLNDFLTSTIGSSIEAIEIYSTPPPGFDASGSGVINIKMKRNAKSDNLSGEVLMNLGYGSYYKSMIGAKINQKAKKTSYFLQYNFSKNKDLYKTLSNRITDLGQKRYFSQINRAVANSDNSTFFGGIDQTISARQIFGFNFSGNYNRQKTATMNNTKIGPNYFESDSSVNGQFSGINKNVRLNVNAFYRYDIDTSGQTLTSDIGGVYYNNNINTSYFNNVASSGKSRYDFRSEFPTDLKLAFVKVDHIFHKKKSLSIASGLKLNGVESDNDFKNYSIFGDLLAIDTINSTHFVYNERIIAGYIQMKWNLRKNIDVEAGLRSEYTTSSAKSIDKNIRVNRDYIDLFPTVSINFNKDDRHLMAISFARRIVRPDYVSLNPFSFNVDLYTVVKGNVQLTPQYSNSIDLTYSRSDLFYSSLGLSLINSPILDVVLIDTLTSIALQTKQNLNSQRNISLNFGLPIKISSRFQSSIDFTGYYNEFAAARDQMWIGSKSQTSFKASMLNSLKISDKIACEVSYFYQSKELSGPILYRSYSGLDAGLNYQMFRDLSIRFSATDLFNKLNYRSSGTSRLMDFAVEQKLETRVFRLVLNYKIGGRSGSSTTTRDNSSETNRIR